MKVLTVFILAVVLSWFSFGQTLTVHKADQTTVSIPLSQIDSITFSSQVGTCPPTVTYAGKIYNTVLIGTQCWLRENLDVGTMVQGSVDQADNGTIDKYCYDNNPANCDTYGGLYQWNEAMQYSTTPGAQGICPPGWHIPTLAEFQTLQSAVGGDGNALKAVGQGAGLGEGTNTSGFSALLAGYRYSDGTFYNLGYYAYVWSSLQFRWTMPSYLVLATDYPGVFMSSDYIQSRAGGASVRCVKD